MSGLLYRKNWIDTVQWHLEAIIRSPTVRPDELVAIKQRIDQSNPDQDRAERELTDFLDSQPIQPSVSWLGVAPFAQHPQKMWPFGRFAPLLTRVLAERPEQVFLFGGC